MIDRRTDRVNTGVAIPVQQLIERTTLLFVKRRSVDKSLDLLLKCGACLCMYVRLHRFQRLKIPFLASRKQFR